MASVADAFFDLLQAEAVDGSTDDVVARLRGGLSGRLGPSEWLGILGKCRLPGCDVHLLAPDQEILRHLETADSTPAGFSEARSYWEAPHESAVAVVVYTDRLEVVMVDGSLVPLALRSR